MKNVFRSLLTTLFAFVVIGLLAGCAQKSTEDVNEEVKKTAEKAGQSDLGAVPPEQASGDAMMMGGGAKKATK